MIFAVSGDKKGEFMKLRIDREFKELLPKLSKEEYEHLEKSIVKEGCREPIVIWDDVIVDGHNRHEICTRHGIQYKTVQKKFKTRIDAMDWIDANQLGRRNLSQEYFRLVIGRRYNRMKKSNSEAGAMRSNAGAPVSGGQNDHRSPKTHQQLAQEHGVSPSTVQRAAKFAEAVDYVKQTDPETVKKGEKEVYSKAREIQKARTQKPTKPKEEPSRDYTETEKKEDKKNGYPSEAMQFALMAISQLERIRMDDPDRVAALDRVERWICAAKNKK